MNTYLIPTTAAYCYEPYDYIFMVYAETDEEAYNTAKEQLKGTNIPLKLSSYEFYPCELYLPESTNIYPFHESKKYDILTLSLKNTKGMEHMAHFNVNWNNYVEELAKKAAPENWSNPTYPNNGILVNYLANTHKKLLAEKKIKIFDKSAIFNTGLYTSSYEPIFAFQKDKDIQFLTEYELDKMKITNLPEGANYFNKPELLLFDPKCKINVQYNHILSIDRNIDRMPSGIKDAKNLLAILIGSIEIMKMKISMNYKLAVPQYYNDQIQLLLPLYLLGNDTPDLALAVSKIDDEHYQGRTCLTLDMAYNNARLITKPEGNWLSK